MQKVECFFDDVNQVYFSYNENLGYEYVRAIKSFGFPKVNISFNVHDIDEMLRSHTGSITDEKRENILTLLSNQIQVPRLKVIMEGIESSKLGFGSPQCAIIVDTNSIWLLIKEKPSNDFIELINKISLSQGVFLVDDAQGIIVDSRSLLNIQDYFEYDA